MKLIQINEEQEFHLTNGKVSYLFRVMEATKTLEHLYYGKAIRHREDFSYLIEREVRPANNQLEGNLTTSLEHIKQELPVFGTTDFRYPALEVAYPAGDSLSQFEYQGYDTYTGKRSVPGLPTTFANDSQAETLVVYLKDRYSELELSLFYTIFTDYPVITRRTVIKNSGTENFFLKQLASLNLDLPTDQLEWLHLNGAWARETQLERDALIKGVQAISSTRGASSHVHNPFLALCPETTTESSGEAFGFSLIYSGNFRGQIEVDSYGISRVQLGINPYQFSWQLAPASQFDTPEAVMVYSETGLNGMSQVFHDFYQQQLVNPRWANQQRPVLLNNWEATYFDFDEEKLLAIATEAADLGVDLFVLDDGWFGKRDDDSSSLGDWFVDQAKLPNGLPSLARKIHEKGLLFGLWFEPEMISKGTKLYEEHPDWLIGQPTKQISHGRNQFVLDFSRKAVVDQIFAQMQAILETSQIDYLKLDMNRYISEAFSTDLPANRQGELSHRYILGVYDLYDRLVTNYPDLLIESCAGGGGRFDPALLYYAPQAWTSDDTDAVERLKIQYGASMVYPLATMGSHVSAVPNHQVARMTSLKMRGDVALFGTFGYELDPTQLTATEKAQVREQIRQFKDVQPLIQQGTFYRLLSPFESNEVAWMVVSQDQKTALVGYYQVLAKPNPPYERLKLQGLNPTYCYQINQQEKRYGDDLAQIGLILGGNYIGRENDYWSREMPGDFASKLFYLRAD
ncbi:alpha-galactosidase [Vagococcus allomyrinae]